MTAPGALALEQLLMKGSGTLGELLRNISGLDQDHGAATARFGQVTGRPGVQIQQCIENKREPPKAKLSVVI
ncbi:hypothetical protein MUY21_02930 [Aliiroseovarius sp. S2029]|nr:hypothetical protein [Aliiroseovarius sp. S2029]